MGDDKDKVRGSERTTPRVEARFRPGVLPTLEMAPMARPPKTRPPPWLRTDDAVEMSPKAQSLDPMGAPSLSVSVTSVSVTDDAKPEADDDQTLGPRLSRGRTKGQWPPGFVVLEDFVVQRFLGAGGMGQVYLVRSRTANREYAVKRTHANDPAVHYSFLLELQNWVDLPDHPNLTKCRFFRTLDDGFVIFSEFVEGGSLKEWIRDDRFESVADKLDVAIQFARGLHAAHQRGLVHQDVKPGNVLLSKNGEVKVTDFGLARGLQSGAADNMGMTPKYCSPEQAQNMPVTERTDIYSWAVSVFEIMLGGAAWSSGVEALDVLQAQGDTRLPRGLYGLLAACFSPAPQDRPASFRVVEDRMVEIYREAVGEAYARPCVDDDVDAWREVELERRAPTGDKWQPPALWLSRAANAAGHYTHQTARPRALSPAAQGIADLAAYGSAHETYARLVGGGSKHLEAEFAALCVEKAFVHVACGDKPGALARLGQATRIRERLSILSPGAESLCALARVYGARARVLLHFAEYAKAQTLAQRAIHTQRQVARSQDNADIARYYETLGRSQMALQTLGLAIDSFERGLSRLSRSSAPQVTAFGRSVAPKNEAKSEDQLLEAELLCSKADALRIDGRSGESAAIYELVVARCEEVISSRGKNLLARALLGRARSLKRAARTREALPFYDQVIALREELVECGVFHLERDLARAYIKKANALKKLGELSDLHLYDKAIRILERLLYQSGRRDIEHELARAFVHRAYLCVYLGKSDAALLGTDGAIRVHERLVYERGRGELLSSLCHAYLCRADVWVTRGDYHLAQKDLEEVLTISTGDHPVSPVLIADAHYSHGAIDLRRGELEAAARHARLANKLGLQDRSDVRPMRIHGLILNSAVRHARGQMLQLGELEQIRHLIDNYPWESELDRLQIETDFLFLTLDVQDPSNRVELLKEAVEHWERLDVAFCARQYHARKAELHRALGMTFMNARNHPQATHHLRQARQLSQSSETESVQSELWHEFILSDALLAILERDPNTTVDRRVLTQTEERLKGAHTRSGRQDILSVLSLFRESFPDISLM